MRPFFRIILMCLALSISASLACAEEPDAASLAHTVWIPYWDYEEAIDEAERYADAIDSLVSFGAIFDANDDILMLPDAAQTTFLLNERFGESHDVYISVVNDVEVSEGVYDNKTTAILKRLFADDESIDRHIGQLLDLAREYEVDGIEIDYEAIKKDVALWERFTRFAERLYAKTEENGLKLRIVLSWDSARYATFPQGPRYSIMCYNLYGYHSGPGPKADRNFLRTTAEINQALPGNVEMAYATGGFDWLSDGGIKALKTDEAERLLAEASLSPDMLSRDDASAALHGVFAIDDAIHEVWYADADTLAYWRELALPYGYRAFALFRMGGNVDLTGYYD